MKKLILLCSICFASTFCSAQAQTTKSSTQRTFVLPVNWADTPKLGMVVSIPTGFKSINAQPDVDGTSALAEYIPDSESEENWTQRITVSKYIGKSASAQTVVAQLKAVILEKMTNAKVWEETNTVKASYQQSMLGMKYEFQSRHELMGAQYNSGPYDCVGVQYTIRPTLTMPDEDIIKIIDAFFKTNIQVVSFMPV